MIGQGDAAFPSAYSGANSLYQYGEVRDTWSVTGYFGYKDPYEGTEFYYNAEPFQGFGLSNTHGIASFSNIEAQKAGYDFPHYNSARLFLRHVFGLGGEQEDIADGPNQVAAKEDISRLTFTFGKLAVGDVFDNNSYSHDGRVSFMNWALVDSGAFNYSADQAGLYLRDGVRSEPEGLGGSPPAISWCPMSPNGENFDLRIGRRGQSIVEVQHNFSLFGMDGIIRVLGFEEQFYAGSYNATLANPFLNPLTAPAGSPGIAATRETRSQFGFVGNAELAATKDRWPVCPDRLVGTGKSEIIYTDINSSLSAGAVLTGTAWGRPLDKVGLAFAVSGLSSSYQNFLRAGGLASTSGTAR